MSADGTGNGKARPMDLGPSRTIDGAKCWRLNRVPAGGVNAFPTLSIKFAEAGMQEFSPVRFAIAVSGICFCTRPLTSAGGLKGPASVRSTITNSTDRTSTAGNHSSNSCTTAASLQHHC